MLSEEKIKKLAKGHSDFYIDSKRRETYDFCTGGILNFARAIEAAVLAEQAKAKPVAWLGHDDFGYNVVKMAKDGNAVIPLYLHPAPAPEGMVLVPREPTEEMLEAGARTFDYGGLAEAEYCWEAMLAAAEKP